MITIEDTQKLAKVMIEALTPIFVTKDEFQRLETKFNRLLERADQFMAEILRSRQEFASINQNQTTIKTWMVPVSKQTGVDYPF